MTECWGCTVYCIHSCSSLALFLTLSTCITSLWGYCSLATPASKHRFHSRGSCSSSPLHNFILFLTADSIHPASWPSVLDQEDSDIITLVGLSLSIVRAGHCNNVRNGKYIIYSMSCAFNWSGNMWAAGSQGESLEVDKSVLYSFFGLLIPWRFTRSNKTGA